MTTGPERGDAACESRNTDVEKWFRFLSSGDLASLIEKAKDSVVYVAPGLQSAVADAVKAAVDRLEANRVLVCLDFDESVMRMGFGDIGAIARLRDAGVGIECIRGLRIGLIAVDDQAFAFAPTALFLESEGGREGTHNAVRLSSRQTTQLLARLSPAARTFAMEKADDPVARAEIETIADQVDPEVEPREIPEADFKQVEQSLGANPPDKFDLARQVRVYQAKLQQVKLEVKGLSFNQRLIQVPKQIIDATSAADVSDRLLTKFRLLSVDDSDAGKLVRELRQDIERLRKTFLRTLNQKYGAAILKDDKPEFNKCVAKLHNRLNDNEKLCKLLQKAIDSCRDEIVNYYVNLVESGSDDDLKRTLCKLWGRAPRFLAKASRDDLVDEIRNVLTQQFDQLLPKGADLVGKIDIDVTWFDFTFETLSDPDFQKLIAEQRGDRFDEIDWSKPYQDFTAAAQKKDDGREENET